MIETFASNAQWRLAFMWKNAARYLFRDKRAEER